MENRIYTIDECLFSLEKAKEHAEKWDSKIHVLHWIESTRIRLTTMKTNPNDNGKKKETENGKRPNQELFSKRADQRSSHA